MKPHPLVAALLLVASACQTVSEPTIVTPTALATRPPSATATPVPPAPAATATRTPPTASPQQPLTLGLRPVVTGLAEPLFLTHADDGTGDLYIVEKGGKIKVARDGAVRREPFLDISSLVRASGGEQGLLGLAFHPRYGSNGFLYVNYTDRRGDTVVARYTAPGDRSVADPDSARTVLAFPQPFANHNGGMLLFGPDGMLWIGTGDGGSGGDPRRNAQNPAQLLGKMLRIDVDRGDPYAIPADNPYRTTPGARPEVWALGLRNPWRYSFDRLTGDLYIGDVGQNAWEEVDFTPAGTPGGINYGWNRMEGSHCFPAESDCDRSGLVLPVAEHANPAEGCSVTGGYVYRGQAFPTLTGTYFFTDYCSGTIWSLRRDAGGVWRKDVAIAGPARAGLSSFGEDEAGELYVTGLSSGTLYQLITSGPSP